jgi:hypothetical protein
MKSVMDHSFAVNPQVDIQRSSFDRSHGHKTTFDAGLLIPVYVDEALPGDTFNMNMTGFGRLATPVNPVMDNMSCDVHFFSVPIRQIWSNWRRFCGEQTDPSDSIDYTVPQATLSGALAEGTFEDYIGLPVGQSGLSYSALFIRAYKHIYNEWYRDQNLIDSADYNTNDTSESVTTGHSVLRRGKRHDYFTSALPWPQKGDAVSLPLGTEAPVIGIGAIDQNYNTGTSSTVYESDGTSKTYSDWKVIDGTTTPRTLFMEEGSTAGYPGIRTDLTAATAATINELRQAFQIQRLLEKDARGGTRYAEIIKSHFGVDFYDVTYRPEFLGGGTGYININPVAQTSSTDATTPQGNLSAFGTVGLNNIGFNKSFNEHCIIMGIASVRADLTYQRRVDRMFSRSTRYDFFWPSLANIGEQSILNKEIYYNNDAADDNVFGYQERYAEYRYKPSQITGQFRSDAATPLDSWHLAQDFSTRPSLNQTFIEENPPIDRVIATASEPHFIFDFYFNLRCARPMPVFGVPGLIDHF